MVSWTARVTDVGSGLTQATFRFTSPSGAQTRSSTAFSSSRTSGTATDGLYAETFTFPAFSEPGVWVLSANLYDAVGNSRALSAAQLQALGIATTLTVTGTGDTSAPDLAAFTSTPASISTATGAATVSWTARVTDVGSGLSQATFRFTSPSGTQTRSSTAFSSSRTSGTATDGTYAESFTFPQFSEPGTWVLSANLYDAVGNSRAYSAAQLQALGFATSLTVTGSGDTQSPALVSFTFTPSLISTSSSSAMVTWTARLTDVGSGLTQATFRFTSPSGSQTRSSTAFSSSRVSGTALDGTYSETFTFPTLSEPGTWQLSANLYDAVGNSRSLSAAQLQALGVATTLTISP
jgi:hypothetical protein